MIAHIKKICLVLCLFIIGIFTTACGDNDSTSSSYPFYHIPAQIELSKTEFTLSIDETDDITVTLNGEDITETANYIVEKKSIATVEKGKIKAIEPGTTKVTVLATGVNGASFTVTVLSSVTLNSKVVDQLYKLGIFEKDYEHISELTEANIPATFTYDGIEYQIANIGEEVFGDCSLLTSVTIPDSVTSIGAKAFENCSSLTSIIIPDSVTKIGQEAFEDCSSLTSINIPDGVTSIEEEVFGDCFSLTSITIPASVTSIGNKAFAGCSSLASITIPDGVTSIGNGAFMGCSSLASLTIPESVTSIGDYAFDYLNNIEISDSQKQLDGYPWGALNVNGEPAQSNS